MNSSTEPLDPKLYVDALLEIYHKNEEIVTRSFGGDAGFVETLDKACQGIVNRNAATGELAFISHGLIHKHADLLLREDGKMVEEGSLELTWNRVVHCKIPSAPLLIAHSPFELDDFVQVCQ